MSNVSTDLTTPPPTTVTIPSVSVAIPTPETNYKSAPTQVLNNEVWDTVFDSVSKRLIALELQRVELQATIDALKSQALETVTETITAEIEARRADLQALEGEFKAVSDAYTELVSGGVYADGIQLRGSVPGIDGHTVQAAITELSADATQASEAIKNIRIVKHLAYDDRAQLRTINGPAESNAVVRGIGFFVWVAGSTEPDDDETCFKTTGGAWELEAVSMDALSAHMFPAIEAAVSAVSGGVAPNFTARRFTYANTVSAVASSSFVTQVVDVPGVIPGEAVFVAPPTKFTSTFDYPFYAYVSAIGKVTVVFDNPNPNTNASFVGTAMGSANPWTLFIVKAN